MKIPYHLAVDFEDALTSEEEMEEILSLYTRLAEYNNGWNNYKHKEDVVKMPPMRVRTERLETFIAFNDSCPAKVIETKKSVEVVTMAEIRTGEALKKIKKLPDGMFLNTETGVIFRGQKNKTRTESNVNLNHSIKELRKLIEENFEDNNGYFVTLTYFGMMTDYDKAGKDFEKFKDKLKYHYELEFIKIVEPKASGSWHFHLLIKAKEGKTLELSEDKVQSLWEHGTVQVKSITNVSGLQMYLASSGTHPDDNDEDDERGVFILSECVGQKKLKEKRERREFYKSGMRLYSCSHGIRKPKKYSMSNGEARIIVADLERTSSETVTVKTRGGHILNVVSYEIFKK